MTCTKCNGLMLSEHILDFYAPVNRWKCINCGWSHGEHQPAARHLDRSPGRCSRKNTHS